MTDDKELMKDNKEYWEQIIGILVLFITTYAVMKDLIADPESTTKAFFLAVVFDVLFVALFALVQKWRKHENKS